MNARADFSPDFSVNMWEIHAALQAATFVYSIILGALLCMLYDFMSAWRTVWHSTAVTVFFHDIFFWLVSALVTFLFLLARSYGELRLYVFVGETLGFALFKMSVSPFWLRFLKFIFGLVKALKLQSDRFYSFILCRLSAFFRLCCVFFQKNIKKLQKALKKLLKK